MSYIDPNTVISPKDSWKLKSVIFNSRPGQGGWSAAEGEWEGSPCLGIRWNGSSADKGVGNPQSRGHATWFIIPEGLDDVIRREIAFQSKTEGMVTCKIHRPEEYQEGAWQITITLGARAKKLGNGALAFTLPTLEKRLCIPEKAYVCAIGGKLQGSFKEGNWLGDIYSNGISEAENPTSIDAVRDAFTQSVMQAIRGLMAE
jgi:hypothetical protein